MGGEVYPDKGAAKQSLPWYARHFGCVEGNSSFYGLPSLDQVKRWCEESVDGFRFSMKFPRAITHDAKLQGPSYRCRDSSTSYPCCSITIGSALPSYSLAQASRRSIGERFSLFLNAFPIASLRR